MKNKGFTLIELLGVIVLLISVATITTLIIVNYVKDANDTLDEGVKTILYSATERYLYDDMSVSANGSYTVTISNLLEKNKLDNTFIENYEISKSSCIKADIVNGAINYEYKKNCD